MEHGDFYRIPLFPKACNGWIWWFWWIRDNDSAAREIWQQRGIMETKGEWMELDWLADVYIYMCVYAIVVMLVDRRRCLKVYQLEDTWVLFGISGIDRNDDNEIFDVFQFWSENYGFLNCRKSLERNIDQKNKVSNLISFLYLEMYERIEAGFF